MFFCGIRVVTVLQAFLVGAIHAATADRPEVAAAFATANVTSRLFTSSVRC